MKNKTSGHTIKVSDMKNKTSGHTIHLKDFVYLIEMKDP